MGNHRAIIVLGLGCAVCAGCARTETRVYMMQASPGAGATWTGRSADEVVEAWGPPTARQSDGEGGRLLVYEHKTGISTSASEGPPTPPDLNPNPRGEAPRVTEEIKRPRAKFWIGADGKVYRFWFSADVYKKGEHTPPAKKSASDE